jgi:hypothetical protein
MHHAELSRIIAWAIFFLLAGLLISRRSRR